MVARDKISLPMAWLGDMCPMPRYRWQQPIPSTEPPPPEGLVGDELDNMFDWGVDSILPYQVQDRYDRALKPSELDVLVLENDRFRAQVAPGLGGRLLSLYDKQQGRDLLFVNPVFQPANLAMLNAWFSGGVEWNGLTPGHSPTTASTIFTCAVDTPRGQILRLYEFDRTTECVWQVDLFLPQGDGPLAVHGRIVNPADIPAQVYWWTNIAVATPEGGRVLSSADYSIEHVLPDNHLARFEFPRDDMDDSSYPQNWVGATSVFFRTERPARNLVAMVDRQGQAVAHIATESLPGRKYFYFGAGSGGQHWMDYLSRPGEGDYVELQGGITPHQNQRLGLAAGQQLDWTAVIMPLSLDPDAAHDPDYRHATDAIDAASRQALPEAELADLDRFLTEAARLPGGPLLSIGAPWGRRHEKLTGRPLTENLDFQTGAPADFWDDLAANETGGSVPATELPEGFALSPRWLARLEALGDDDWRGTLFRSIAALDRGETAEAQRLACLSLKRHPSWLGHRQLALTTTDPQQKQDHYLAAWLAGNAPDALAVEIAEMLAKNSTADALSHFIEGLPDSLRTHERIILAKARIAAVRGDIATLEQSLEHEFATIREGETITETLWDALLTHKLANKLGRDPETQELARARIENPLPNHLDFRMQAAAPRKEVPHGKR